MHTTDAAPARLAGIRSQADMAFRYLSYLGVLGCAIQFAFAGLGMFSIPDEIKGITDPVAQENAEAGGFSLHATNGAVLGYIALVMLIAAIVARPNKKSWINALVITVLMWVVQGISVGLGFEVSPWFGALHAFSGVVVTGLFVWMAIDATRRARKA
jgi:hypothetical protein